MKKRIKLTAYGSIFFSNCVGDSQSQPFEEPLRFIKTEILEAMCLLWQFWKRNLRHFFLLTVNRKAKISNIKVTYRSEMFHYQVVGRLFAKTSASKSQMTGVSLT